MMDVDLGSCCFLLFLSKERNSRICMLTKTLIQVFARGLSILGSNGFTRAARIYVPVHFQDNLWVNPGDIIVGDDDGVVVTPPSLVDQVVELCRARADVDEKMLKALREGAEMGPLIKDIRKNN
jgi:regulator of RNase E activity RraA